MRTTFILSGAALLVGVVCFGIADDKVVPKRGDKVNPPPAAKIDTKVAEKPNAKLTEKAGAKPIAKPTEKTPPSPPVTEKSSADEVAIRQTDDSFPCP